MPCGTGKKATHARGQFVLAFELVPDLDGRDRFVMLEVELAETVLEPEPKVFGSDSAPLLLLWIRQ